MAPLQLGLADGATYQLDVFVAQRHRADPSQIQLVTSVDFGSGEPVSTFCAGGSTPPRVSSGPFVRLGLQLELGLLLANTSGL